MDYPVIDPVGTGRMLGIADMSTMYKWLRGDALPGIDTSDYSFGYIAM